MFPCCATRLCALTCALTCAASCAHGQGNVDRACELFQEGVWADPMSTSTCHLFHAWGVLERTRANFQVARELFKAAIKVSTTD